MSKFIIEGGVPLSGRHVTPGNKNAALPMIAAALLADSPVTLTNLPSINDVKVMLELARKIGADVEADFDAKTAKIDPRPIGNPKRLIQLPADLCNQIRTSILFAGPLCARKGGIVLPPPGGDVIGRRRLDTHFDGLRQLGVAFDTGKAPFRLKASQRLQGARILLDEASVTATENLLMAAVLAEGRTQIFNVACEPHVQNLCRMLIGMGAQIDGVGTNKLVIDGVDTLHGTTARIAPDYIETASYIAAAAATHGSIEIDGTVEEDFEVLERPFSRLGVHWTRDPQSGRLVFDSRRCKLRVTADLFGSIPKIEDGIWPSTPTDMMSALIVLATQADGIILFFEKMFESRMVFVDNLIGMGAQIVQCDPHRIVVKGASPLRGTHITSPDIRAGMALIIAGLCAKGRTEIANAESIDRGYEAVEQSLAALGARITRVND